MLLKKRIALVAALVGFSSHVMAEKVEISNLINDQGNERYIGAGNSNDAVGSPASNYEIYSMQVKRTTTDDNKTFLNVTINTNFLVGDDTGNGNIHYGDLFIAGTDHYDPDKSNEGNAGANDATFDPSGRLENPGKDRRDDLGSDTRWDYGFNLNERDTNHDGQNDNAAGTLYDILSKNDGSTGWYEKAYANSLKTASEYNDRHDGRANQAVALYDYKSGHTSNGGNYLNNVGSGTWTTNTNGVGGAKRQVVFNIDVTGITALMNAESLAFRWAMTCANDIVEGVATFAKADTIPEPGMIALMGLALGGLVYRRKTQA